MEAIEKKKKKQPIGMIVFYVILYLVFAISIFVTLYPFWNLCVISLNEPYDSLKGGLTFWPRKFSWINYATLFEGNNLDTMTIAALNSVLRTVLGTLINTFFSTLIAYALTRPNFILRKFMNTYVVIPMYISVGLIPTYLLYQDLGLLDSFAVYIVPNLISAYNIIILRTYIGELPSGLSEAAKLDGAGEHIIFFRVILPLTLPSLATVSLFIAVFHWSSWQDTMFYANRNGLQTLQYEMAKIVRGNTAISSGAGSMQSRPTTETLNAAITIVATLPIIILYPFLQKYFVNGMTIGAVKE